MEMHICCDAQKFNRNIALHKMPQQAAGTHAVRPQLLHPGLRVRRLNGVEKIMLRNWMRVTSDAGMLSLETQRVIGLRLMKLSRGGRGAEAEAIRMVTEKASALVEAGMTLARGGSATTVIRRYRTHVRANKRRLLKS